VIRQSAGGQLVLQSAIDMREIVVRKIGKRR
jgi:hypothetical protein